MATKKRDILDLFEEVHDLDRHIELVNKEVQITQQVIRRLSNKAITEEEIIRKEMAFDREKELNDVLVHLQQRREVVWSQIRQQVK